jgi:hypothetical protein
MGLTFHYSGRIRQYEKIDEMVDEVEDICKSLAWEYHIISDDKLKGIVLTPENSEPLSLTFVPDGRLCSIISVMVNEPDDPFYYTAFTKTQFAGPDTHIALLKLLCYLSDKYFSEIEVNDEGLYWDTLDRRILLEQFAKYNYALDAVAGVISGMNAEPGESPQSSADRIEETLKKKFGGEK